MKTEDYYLADMYATNHNLITAGAIDVAKIKDYIKNSPNMLQTLLIYVNEVSALQLTVGDAVVCEDKKKRLVVELIWESKDGETAITKAKLIDVGGYSQTFPILTLKKVG